MFSPTKVNGEFLKKIVSLYVSNGDLAAGSLVALDETDTAAFGDESVGFTTMRGGSVVAATIGTGDTWKKVFGVAIPDVEGDGIPFEERILGMAESYMTIPVGYAVALFKPATGDIIATSEYVGFNSGDSGAPGYLDISNAANAYKPLGVFQGKFRIAQAGDEVIGRYVGNTTVGGDLLPMVEFA